MPNKVNLWVAGAVVAVLAIFAAAWFLLISPVLDTASSLDDQRTQVEGQNQALTAQNATLRQQFANIDQMRADLALLHEEIPATVGTDSFLDQLGTIASDNGATITKVDWQPAVAVTKPTTAPAPADASTADASAAGSADAPTPVASPTATTQAIPVSIGVDGSRDAVLGTIAGLQKVDQRLFLVGQIDIKGTPVGQAQPGLPDAVAGDVTAIVSGYIFVQPPLTATSDQQAPQPSTGNQFAPSS